MFKNIFVFLLFCGAMHAQNLKNKTLAVPENILSVEDVIYASYGERKMNLDFYRPKKDTVVPVIVLVHGGGWAKGSRKSFQAMAVMLAENGFAVANIDYRLSGEAKFPAAIEDCKAATRWVRANAEKYHLNKEKVFGIGGSAGGHIVAMAALTEEGKYEGKGGNTAYSSKLKAAVILGSGVDQYKRVLAVADQRIENCIKFLGEFKGNEEVYIEASPITHLSKGDPDIFMLDAELDNPGERYVDFITKMKTLGIPYKFKVIPKAKHGQWTIEPFRADYINAFTAFLKKY